MNPNESITIAEATGLLPQRNGRKIHVQTVIRWITKGCRGVRLNAQKYGNCWFTTEQDIQKFQEELTAKALPGYRAAVPPRAQMQRSRNMSSAMAYLEREGIRK